MDEHPAASESHRTVINSALRAVRRRLCARVLLENTTSDLVIATGFFLALLVCDRLLLPGMAGPTLLLAVLSTSLSVSLLRTVFLDIPSRFEAAAAIDRSLQLKERVATAYVTEANNAAELVEVRGLLCRDAARHLKEFSVGTQFPIRLPRSARYVAGLVVVLCAVALWMPVYDFLGIERGAAAAAELKDRLEKEAKDLDKRFAELAKKLEQKKDPEAKKLLALLKPEAAEERKKRDQEKNAPEAGQKNARPAAPRADPRKAALVEFSRREDAIRKAMKSQSFQELEKARKALQTLGVQNARLTRKLRKALKDGKFEKAQEELQALRDRLDQLAKKKASELTAGEKKELAELQQELSQLSRDSAAMQKLSGGLSRASSGLQAGDLGEGLEGLELSLDELGDLASLEGDLETLEQALQMVQGSKSQVSKLCKNCGAQAGSRPGGT